VPLACQLEPQHRQVVKRVRDCRRHMATPLARSLVRHNGTSNGIFTTLLYTRSFRINNGMVLDAIASLAESCLTIVAIIAQILL
jgi:hypothetical protein